MKRRRIQRPSLQYQIFEARQLLAADAVRPLVSEQASFSSEFNLVINGDFSTANNGVDGLFHQDDVEGWQSSQTIVTADKIRIKDHAVDGFHNAVNLDVAAGQLDGIFQDIATQSGQNYLLTFQLRALPVDSSADAATNDLEVFWNESARERSPEPIVSKHTRCRSPRDQGRRLALSFERSGGAGSASDDGIGPLLDNVKLSIIGSSILENGDFETVSSTTTSDLFDDGDVAGWSVMGNVGERQLSLGSSGAFSGTRYLNVDGFDSRTDHIYQDFQTQNGASYLIEMSARTDPASTNDSNELRIRWANDWTATIRPTADWVTYRFVVAATSDSTRLVIREPGTVLGDGLGPWVDSFSITRLNRDGSVVFDANGSATGIDDTATFTEDGGSTKILSDNLEISNQQGTTIDGATIVLDANPDGSSELLGVDVGSTAIVPAYNATTRTLTLSGTDTLENYRTVLSTLSYSNPSQNPTTTDRHVTITLRDDGVFSEAATITIAINATNDAPSIDPIADSNVSTGDTYSEQVIVSDPDSTAFTYSLNINSKTRFFDSGRSTDFKHWTFDMDTNPVRRC
ncbi:MAG: DUF642 domain-containing protein [Pirellulaceae bacterium]